MNPITRLCFLLILLMASLGTVHTTWATEVTYHAQAEAIEDELPLDFLNRFHLDRRHLPAFLLVNEIDSPRQWLNSGTRYRLPAYVHAFDGKSIRIALNVSMDRAVHLRNYNQELSRSRLKPALADDRKIWVPYDQVLARARERETTATLLARFGLQNLHLSAFNQLNDRGNEPIDAALDSGHLYRLPIRNRTYLGPTIGEALGVTPYDAHRILEFNRKAQAKDLKKEPWNDHLIWQPYHLQDNPAYGPIYRQFEVTSDQLRSCVFFLSPGHGGPDPGTHSLREGQRICEDEYALDITLRLARELEKQGARIEVAIRDEGIRDIKFLPCDSDEEFSNGQALSTDQTTRLRQRIGPINRKYAANSGSAIHQRFLAIHIDFRNNSDTHVDFDIYHFSPSDEGEKMAATVQQTIEHYYDSRLGGRSFVGRIVSQNEEDSFYVLRETKMPAVLLELANISNELDQLRFIVIDSRQRIAEWLCEGLVADWENSKGG